MNLPALIVMLKRHEGVRLFPYTDTAGKLTIGVGRNLTDVGITANEAGAMLANDIERLRVELGQRMSWWTLLDDVRQNVIADMAFNMGVAKLLTFKKFLSALWAKDYDGAAREMLDSEWSRQVGTRATELADMMRSGQAS